MTPTAWDDALSYYTEAEQQTLENAAEAHADRIDKAARDLSDQVVVDGIDISELWFAVLRRRAELADESVPQTPEEVIVIPAVTPEVAAADVAPQDEPEAPLADPEPEPELAPAPEVKAAPKTKKK